MFDKRLPTLKNFGTELNRIKIVLSKVLETSTETIKIKYFEK